MDNAVKKGKRLKKKITRAAFSKTFISGVLFVVSILITIVYSLWNVKWDPNLIDWGKFAWNMSLIIGLFLVALFCGWTMEQQNILVDDESELSITRVDYKKVREKIRPKDQYFGQYYLWEKARQINELKADALTQIGWRSATGGTYAGEVLNATAQDIAFYATEDDIRQAENIPTNDAVLVDHKNGKRFYISHISHEMAEETIKILKKEEEIDFCSPDYYLIGSSYDADDLSPRFAKGKTIAKKNTKKAAVSIISSVALMALWAILVAGAVIDNSYGDNSEVYFNLLSRIMSLFGGFLRGIGISDNYYDGIALLLRDKIEVLENFYNVVMCDGNFKPDTLTATAESIFLEAREKERKKRQAEEEAKRKEEEAKREELLKEEPKEEPKPKEEIKKEEQKKVMEEKISISEIM